MGTAHAYDDNETNKMKTRENFNWNILFFFLEKQNYFNYYF